MRVELKWRNFTGTWWVDPGLSGKKNEGKGRRGFETYWRFLGKKIGGFHRIDLKQRKKRDEGCSMTGLRQSEPSGGLEENSKLV